MSWTPFPETTPFENHCYHLRSFLCFFLHIDAKLEILIRTVIGKSIDLVDSIGQLLAILDNVIETFEKENTEMRFCQMSYWTLCLALVSIILGSACLTGGGEGTLGDLFKALSHKYLITDDADCYVQISGSEINAVNSKGEKTCVREDVFLEESTYTYRNIENLLIDGTLKEDRITGTMVYTDSDEEADELCLARYSHETTFKLDLRKIKGAQSQGRFASLAGDWEGELEVNQKYIKELIDVVPGGCSQFTDDPDGEEDEWSKSAEIYEISAQIGGSDAVVHYENTEDAEESESFEVDDHGDYLVISGETVEIE